MSDTNKDQQPSMANVKPWDYPLGSLESRIAARAELEERGVASVMVMTGLPCPIEESAVVEPPDSIEHYRAVDGSIVQLIRREYEPGKFTAFIHQTWRDGGIYRGSFRVDNLREIRKTCEKIPLEMSVYAFGAEEGGVYGRA
jgi:hypothetical protein